MKYIQLASSGDPIRVSASNISSRFILEGSFKIQNFKNMQRTLRNTTTSLSPSKSIEQIFSSALKSYDKACKKKSNEDYSSRLRLKDSYSL